MSAAPVAELPEMHKTKGSSIPAEIMSGDLTMNIYYAAIVLLGDAMEETDGKSKDMIAAQKLQQAFQADQATLAGLLAQIRSMDKSAFDGVPPEGTEARAVLDKMVTLQEQMYGDTEFDTAGNIVKIDEHCHFHYWVQGQMLHHRVMNGNDFVWNPNEDSAYCSLKEGAFYFYNEKDRTKAYDDDDHKQWREDNKDYIDKHGNPNSSEYGLGKLLQMAADGESVDDDIAQELWLLLDDDETQKGNFDTLASKANQAGTTMQGVDQQESQEMEKNSTQVQTLSKSGQDMNKNYADGMGTMTRNQKPQ